jgi:UTP--glucose-1-phosphate uridylyltransferase
MREDDIEPIDSLPDSEGFEAFRHRGERALHRVAVVKLNGGLGTGMGLQRAKSLLEVRDGLTFLDLIARQALAERSSSGASIPLVLMNSRRTEAESEGVLSRYPDLALPGLPGGFLQNRVPKILATDMSPAGGPDDPLAWCPPGHGDLYTAIAASGMLDTLLARGFEYAFVSNADNLGAVLDAGILGFMAEHGHDFVMEAADRSAADRKGGHLCRLRDGRLALRESAQCRPEDEAAFQDTQRHRFFNTNNIWLHLPTLSSALDDAGGYLPLDTIVNQKHLDPRDPESPRVFQLETAMGAAISLFERAAAVRVPRRRFSPVKTTDDLLGVRSDAYRLTDDWRVVLHPDREKPPVIRLDKRFFKMIDDFERRFPEGPPSLRGCSSLAVEGDITFGANVVIEGATTLRSETPAAVPPGSNLTGEMKL